MHVHPIPVVNSWIKDESVTQITNKYEEFQTKVRGEHLGKTAQFWISFMDDTELVNLLIHAVKKKTIENYSLRVMVKWPISSLLSTDKITEDKFYFHFFEMPLDNIKILKQHSLGKTINRYYDKNTRLICLSFFSLDASLGSRCI